MSRAFLACATSFVAAAFLVGHASAQVPTVDPTVCSLKLNPGEETTIDLVVKIPGIPIAPKADIYILADTTGSMGTVLDSVKANVGNLVNTLFSIPGADLRIGVGAYRDFPITGQGNYAFEHRLSMSNDLTAISNAVNTWAAAFGGDQSEAGFFALEKLSTEPAANFGWRDGTKRIIVWFGDAPSHDPVCTQFTGLANDITESSVIAALQATGTTVVAITTPTNLPQGLNDNPAGTNAQAYEQVCNVVRGTQGQATRIANATGGLYTAIPNVNDITLAILQSLSIVFNNATVAVKAEGGIVPFVTGISPGPTNVILPPSANQFVELTFQVDIKAGPCVENQLEYTGALRVCINGQPTDAVKQVELEQNACVALCVWAIGFQKTNELVGVGMPGPADRAYIVPAYVYPVLMNDIPHIPIPNIPSLIGAEIYTQVMMYNPTDFPNDPLKLSNAVMYKIGQGTAKFGSASGIQHFPTQNPSLGGTLGMGFYFQ